MDVPTLVVVNSIASTIEVGVLILLGSVARHQQGPRWWALGMAGVALGFVASYLRLSPQAGTVALTAATFLFLGGLTSFHVGFARFAETSEREAPLLGITVVSTAIVAVGAAADAVTFVYGVVTSIAFAVTALTIVRVLLRPQLARQRLSSRIVLLVFAVLFVFEIYRALVTLTGGPSPDPFGGSAVAIANQVLLLALGLILTFGLVLMSTERLTWEILESRERVDRADRAEMVARLAGGVAHNFNNLLQTINGNAEFVADTLPPDDPRLADLLAIEEAGKRAAELTRVLLEFGRRSGGPPARVEVDAAVGSVVTLLTGAAPKVTVRPGAPGAAVLIAPDDLREMIASLVLRARAVTPPDRLVTLVTAEDEVVDPDPRRPATARPGRYWRISVADAGPAIPADRLRHMFDPFYSAREGDWTPDVGLSGVEGIASAAGGFVLAEAGPGTGSTLSAFLPLADEAGPI